jgi:hypothetical protein
MQFIPTDKSLTNKLRILFCIVLFEYLLFIYAGVSFSFLSGNEFFSLEADPVFWIIYLSKIPQFIAAHQWPGILLDITIVVLILLFIRNPYDNKLGIALFILLMLFYTMLMGHLAHKNYQTGFFMLFIPFMFKSEKNRSFAFEAIRYYLLFFYASAAVLKLNSQALLYREHFSDLLSGQFTPYFLEGNLGIRTTTNLYLINHPAVSYTIYLLSVLLELLAFIGFFTKRYDKWLAVLFLSFHFTNWFIMDIGPFGQIAFISLLFLGKEMKLQED